MCKSGEIDTQDFADDYAGEKYRNVVFINGINLLISELILL